MGLFVSGAPAIHPAGPLSSYERSNIRMNYYVHNVPGRLRVKIPEIKGDAERYSDIQKIFHKFDRYEQANGN